jgi:hypothetical protein
MGVATVLTVLIVPVFFRVFQAVGERYFGEGAAPVEVATGGTDSSS